MARASMISSIPKAILKATRSSLMIPLISFSWNYDVNFSLYEVNLCTVTFDSIYIVKIRRGLTAPFFVIYISGCAYIQSAHVLHAECENGIRKLDS